MLRQRSCSSLARTVAAATYPDRMTTVDLPAPVVGSLSPSRAADFMNCPLLYRFRVVDRLPEEPSEAATRGTVVHAVLERLFDLPAAGRDLAAAVSLLPAVWAELLAEEPELAALLAPLDADPAEAPGEPAVAGVDALPGFLSAAPALLERYFALEDPRRLEPAERELAVSTVLDDGLLLRGFVDRLDVSPAGDLRVVDYKTGRAPGPGFEAKAMFQMRFYALVLWRARGRVPRMLQLMYLGSGEVVSYAPDEADLLATERKVRAVWAAIDRATRAGDWRPNPSRLCDYCSHRDTLCPAFGGTPPPLPESSPPPGLDAPTLEAPSPHTPGDEV